MYRYNKRSGKYVSEYLNDRILRYTQERNESNQLIGKKKNGLKKHEFGKLYENWKQETKREIGYIGESESKLAGDLFNTNHASLKGLGLRKYRHIKGSEQDHANIRAKRRARALKRDLKSKQDIQKKRITKLKRERFRKWWLKNKDKVKARKRLRRLRPY